MAETTKVDTFIQSSPRPAWLATTQGHCVYANPALECLTGLNSDQINQADWRSFLLEGDRAVALASWQRSLNRSSVSYAGPHARWWTGGCSCTRGKAQRFAKPSGRSSRRPLRLTRRGGARGAPKHLRSTYRITIYILRLARTERRINAHRGSCPHRGEQYSYHGKLRNWFVATRAGPDFAPRPCMGFDKPCGTM